MNFINEKLSTNNYKLFLTAKNLQKAGVLKYVWHANGKIYVKEADNSNRITIRDESQLTEHAYYETDSEEFDMGQKHKRVDTRQNHLNTTDGRSTPVKRPLEQSEHDAGIYNRPEKTIRDEPILKGNDNRQT